MIAKSVVCRRLATALIFLMALFPVLSPTSGNLVYADAPPGTTPPTIDGLLDESYVCDGSTTAPDTPGKLYHYFDDAYCYYALVVDRAYNDNVFGPYDGTILDGWTQHKFRHLETSDGALFTGAVPGCEFNLDYLDRAGTPAQWCSGTCGDAYYMTPAGCTAIEAATSMFYNATQSLYGQTNLNPAESDTDSWVSPPLDYSCVSGDYYEWDMIYEFRVPVPASGCGSLQLSSSHNSPSKAEQHQPGLARLGNFVWYDANGNGAQDDGGGGMRTVCMYLKQAGPDGLLGTPDDVQVGVTHTDSEGEYWFNYLQPGIYYVDPGGVCISDGYCHTINLDEVSNDNGSMNDPSGIDPPVCGGGATALSPSDPFPIELDEGEIYRFADFGYDNAPTAAFLASFTAKPADAGIAVRWTTAAEAHNLGFNVYRALWAEGPQVLLNDALIPTQVPPGSSFGAVYEFVDDTARPGMTHYYWLEAVDLYGQVRVFGPVRVALHKLSGQFWRGWPARD